MNRSKNEISYIMKRTPPKDLLELLNCIVSAAILTLGSFSWEMRVSIRIKHAEASCAMLIINSLLNAPSLR